MINGAILRNVLLADGCKILQSEITDSVVGLRSQIADGVRMNRTIMMGADYFDPVDVAPPSNIPLGIGRQLPD